jgi:hypothetical protein
MPTGANGDEHELSRLEVIKNASDCELRVPVRTERHTPKIRPQLTTLLRTYPVPPVFVSFEFFVV